MIFVGRRNWNDKYTHFMGRYGFVKLTQSILSFDLNIEILFAVDPQACRDRDHFEQMSRDPVRSPFQWDSTKNAGFSSAEKTWLPIALNYSDCNVAQQLKEKRSNLRVFVDLMTLRQNPTMKYGELDIKAIDDEILLYKREIKDDPSADIVIVILNLGTNTRTVDLTEHFSNIPREMVAVITSVHSTTAPK